MKANKTYIASDGYEYFMCPMTKFTVTQVENVGTHKGTKAVDFASGTAGYRAPYYAPATVKCIRTIPSHGEATWQTVNKVHCPNGYFGIVTFETVHDDSFDAYAGLTIKQGQQLGNMGTKGYATGVHVHMEFTQSSNTAMHYNSYNIYTYVAEESYVDDTFYVDDTEIVNGGKGNWRKVGSSAKPNTNTSSTPSAPSNSTPDQILSVGSKVKFTGGLRVEKYANGLVYNSRIGGWINPSICYEDSAKDGKQDQYFANTNATFTIQGEYSVSSLRKVGSVWQAYLKELGFWVNTEPLIETKNG